VEVRAFKQPSAEELNHDFLWRYQRALPGRGRIGIFNRSHYEEVLVVRASHPGTGHETDSVLTSSRAVASSVGPAPNDGHHRATPHAPHAGLRA